MVALEKLQAGIEELLARFELLKKENSRLRNENVMLANDRKNLADANKALLASLEQERALRGEALDRIDGLLRKIRERNSAG